MVVLVSLGIAVYFLYPRIPEGKQAYFKSSLTYLVKQDQTQVNRFFVNATLVIVDVTVSNSFFNFNKKKKKDKH